MPVPALRIASPGRLRRCLLASMLVCVALAAQVPPAGAAEVVTTGGRAIRLDLNKGTLVRLDRPAHTVFVADPEICDIHVKSPSLVYLFAKKSGATSLFAVDAGERVLASFDVTVTPDLTRLNAAVRSLYPDADISLSSVEDSVVIDGVVGNATVSENVRRMAARFVGEKADLINRLGIAAPTQVNLRVRIAEVSRDVEKQLGINWQVAYTDGLRFLFATINPFSIGGVANAVGVGKSFGNWDVNAVIDALDTEGLISILAEPNLTAVSGETASFLAGGEFPILVPDDDKVVVEFKKFGVSLAFTPTFVGEDRINLHVRPEVSQLSNEGAVSVPLGITGNTITIPALTVRRAETTVELGSGQSFAIGGLLQNDTTHDISRFPLLGNIPILGRLFSSDRFQRKESELVIIVTPYIVRPSSTRLAAPTDGFSPPHDVERVFPGGTWRRNPVRGPASTVTPAG
ncbi:MAG TPA: type II and III secretion system protein family protein, partial [Rhodospirillales bacterium]|nr:type II and III secretion system protein family protein [Rhodospirillales bacterium]